MAKAAAKKKGAPTEDVVEVFDCAQRSEEWFALHVGVLSASRFAAVMAQGDGEDGSRMRRTLLFQIAAERLSEGRVSEGFRNAAMERGIEEEPAAREEYARVTFEEVKEVGFIRRTITNPLGSTMVVGCSPDALVGERGMLEIKSMRADLLLQLAERGAAAGGGHKPQIQGQLWVAGRDYCDLRYRPFPEIPPRLTFRVERDEHYISRLKDECERFEWEVGQLVKKYGVRK